MKSARFTVRKVRPQSGKSKVQPEVEEHEEEGIKFINVESNHSTRSSHITSKSSSSKRLTPSEIVGAICYPVVTVLLHHTIIDNLSLIFLCNTS